MKILVMRHGEAGQGPGPDAHRFLTLSGRAHVLLAAASVAEANLVPTSIYTSPLVRAVQTAELLARATGFPGPIVTLAPLVPGGDPTQALAPLRYHSPDEVVALVSHEPTVRSLGAELTGDHGFAHFSVGEVAVFEGDADGAKLLSRLRG